MKAAAFVAPLGSTSDVDELGRRALPHRWMPGGHWT